MVKPYSSYTEEKKVSFLDKTGTDNEKWIYYRQPSTSQPERKFTGIKNSLFEIQMEFIMNY